MTNPVWLSVTYAEPCGHHVALRISANNDPSLSISVLHESITGLAQYDLAGNGTVDDLVVQDNELLAINVRNDHGEIIACGLFEVHLVLIEELSAVLSPCVSAGLVMDQCPQRLLDRAAVRALDAGNAFVEGVC